MKSAVSLAMILPAVGFGGIGTPVQTDLGVIWSHRKLQCGFSITNSSASAWHVVGSRSSCACLSADVRPGDVNPGEALPVGIVFDPAGMEGNVSKSVQIDFANRGPELRTYVAEVRVRVGFTPSDASFGVLKRSETGRTLTARLRGTAAEACAIDIVPPENSVFAVERTSDGKGLTVGLRDPMLPSGAYAEIWKIRTTDPEVGEIAFPISAHVTDDFSISPSVITIARGEAFASRLLVLRPSPGKPAFKIVSAETKPRRWGNVKVTSRPLGGWQVVITDIDVRQLGQFSRKAFLRVVTDLPQGVVDIPVNM